MPNTITPEKLAEKKSSGEAIAIIDVRTPVEFREVHVPGAINLPLDRVSPDAVLQLSNSLPVYVICQSGQRSSKACDCLADNPLVHVELVEGGTEGWIKSGLEVVRGKKAVMSLERQVRLTAGLLVLTGTLVGFFIHPAGLLLSGGVATGLSVSAITNTCPMAVLLGRMPWNQVRA